MTMYNIMKQEEKEEEEKKKAAIITGSSRGIGKETAIILAKNKAVNVVVCSRTEREINSVVEGIKKLLVIPVF
jgi:short-subunit dehydrogenase